MRKGVSGTGPREEVVLDRVDIGSDPDKAGALRKKLSTTRQRWRFFGSPEFLCLARIESALLRGARRYLEEAGFVELLPPHITKATGACENIHTMFELDYFGERAYLSQTGQLYLEALAPYLEKVCCVVKSFRAEPDVDERHLTEFTLIELEFVGSLEELIRHAERTITAMIQEALGKARPELEFLGADIDYLETIRPPFERLTYTEAVELLRDEGVEWGDDLKSSHEKKIVSYLGNRPVFVTHYPKAIKFFNMRQNPFNPNVVNSVDLLLPYSGEALGGAEREYEPDVLLERLRGSTMLKLLIEKGGSEEDFEWYIDLYRHGARRPHAGCGIGLNRVTQFVLGLEDIRATTLYPMNREALW